MAWLGTKAETSFYLGKHTKGLSLRTLSGGSIVDLGVDNVYPGKNEPTSGSTISKIEMTESSATLQPNTFHV